MKNQYTIHEVSTLLGLSTDAIRLYEKEGLVTPLRNQHNHYRYYGANEIHRIMGISLYRQLNVSIAEINQLLSVSDFPQISSRFSDFIHDTEEQIELLQVKLKKMRFMKEHLDTLNHNLGQFSVQRLPECYKIFTCTSEDSLLENFKPIITSPVFSYGNFCHFIQRNPSGQYVSQRLDFLIREPMIHICPWSDQIHEFEKINSCDCIYTVIPCGNGKPASWQFDDMVSYARKLGYSPKDSAYGFYVYSLMGNQQVTDYYEVYLPVTT